MELFEVRDLTFTYPDAEKPALKDVCFQAEKGSFLLLCGKSGSGKTTLLRHFKQPLVPYGKRQGEVIFEGTPVSEMDVRAGAEKIGFVMQDPDSQIVTDKVWHELAFGLESVGTDPDAMRIRVAEIASFFGITSWFHRDVKDLSGGEKQILNLASVMVMQPDLLILDEPASELSPKAAGEFYSMLRKIQEDIGTTILLSEHRLEDVYPMADRVLVLEEGEICADGTPKEVAEELLEEKADMAAALPVPAKIAFRMGERDDLPLSVGAGRKWLSDRQGTIPVTELAGKEQPEEKPLLTAEELWFRYEKNGPDILKGASLSLLPGKLTAILGDNGAGKSTLLKCLCGVCTPDRGYVRLSGKKTGRKGSRKADAAEIAMLPQNPKNLFVKKTVREELAEMSEDYEQTAHDLELEDVLDRHPYDLSGGEAERTALAKVLLLKPKVVLLDEPTKGMDRFFKESFAALLKKAAASGTAFCVVSHDVEFCAEYADMAALLFDGEITALGPASEFFSGNAFYTSAANRMCREIFPNAVTEEEVMAAWRKAKNG